MILENGENYCDVCKKAFKKGNFVPLFRGQEECAMPHLSKSYSIEHPTDWERIIILGIYKLFSETRDNRILSLCRSALTEMLSNKGTALDVWYAFNVFVVLVKNEKAYNAPFHIVNGSLLEEVYYGLETHKIELQAEKLWPKIAALSKAELKNRNIDLHI